MNPYSSAIAALAALLLAASPALRAQERPAKPAAPAMKGDAAKKSKNSASRSSQKEGANRGSATDSPSAPPPSEAGRGAGEGRPTSDCESRDKDA